MDNKSKTPEPLDDFAKLSFLNNPHDKYARYSLQIRDLALAFFQFALDVPTKMLVDWETLQLSNDSYIDEDLQGHYTGVCYSGMTVAGNPFRIALLIEHKSVPPEPGEITEQIGRYIFNGRRDDLKKGQSLTLTIPIVLYHGRKRLTPETPATIFPGAPEMLHCYVPSFTYIIVDLGGTSDETITELGFPALQQFLMALKYSRNEKKIALFWTDFLKFATGLNEQLLYIRFAVVTFRYLSATSTTIFKKINEMKNITASPEEKILNTYLEDRFEEAWTLGIKEGIKEGKKEGIKEGMENTILIFIRKNPALTDGQIADLFEVSLSFVKKIRTSQG
jgi:predicted transposase YdaD